MELAAPLWLPGQKAAREAERKVYAEERALQRQALVTGDERYLPVRDKGVAKRFTRDYVDALMEPVV